MSVRTVAQEREEGDCPECGGDVRADAQELVCDGCGLVVDEARLDRGERNNFRSPHRGPPRTAARHDHGLGTASLGRVDHLGRNVQSHQLRRMRKLDRRAHFDSSRERNLAHALGEVHRMTTALGQSRSIQEQASTLARTAQRAGLFVGRSIEAMAAAGVLAALRVNGRPFAARELEPFARVDEDAIRVAYRAINRELSLPAAPPKVADGVPKLASAVGLPERVEAAALELAREVDGTPVPSGRRPSGLAAACIYVAAKGDGTGWTRFTQAELAEAANVTPHTIRSNIAAMEEAGHV